MLRKNPHCLVQLTGESPPVIAAPNSWHIGSVTFSTALTLLNRIEVASEPAGDQQ